MSDDQTPYLWRHRYEDPIGGDVDYLVIPKDRKFADYGEWTIIWWDDE